MLTRNQLQKKCFPLCFYVHVYMIHQRRPFGGPGVMQQGKQSEGHIPWIDNNNKYNRNRWKPRSSSLWQCSYLVGAHFTNYFICKSFYRSVSPNRNKAENFHSLHLTLERGNRKNTRPSDPRRRVLLRDSSPFCYCRGEKRASVLGRRIWPAHLLRRPRRLWGRRAGWPPAACLVFY